MKINPLTLAKYINSLQINGRYTFTRPEAMAALQITPNAFKLAALRLAKKKRLVRLKNNFYVIVPTEYQEVGAPPAAWFIDYLMRFKQQPYYVGLLSAAALHGAAHQQSQVFQVVTTKSLRPIQAGRAHIEFLTKKQITSDSYQSIKTPTGYMNVSIPEITALDLVRYVKSAGHLNLVATILSELQERLDMDRLSNILESKNLEAANIQRLGYLLELVDADKKIIGLFKQAVKKLRPRAIPLRSDKPYEQSQKNSDWMLYINEVIESDI
jgi:predicted transcriptional regulator of viral defense system